MRHVLATLGVPEAVPSSPATRDMRRRLLQIRLLECPQSEAYGPAATRQVAQREAMMATRCAWKEYPLLAGHAGNSVRGLLVIVIGLCALSAAGAHRVGAQGGTPAAGSDAPTANECTVAPRSESELHALFREAAATPIPDSLIASPAPATPPAGVPADEQTVAAITATWRQYLACLTAGDQPRMFALLSDAMVRRQFVVDIAFGVTEDALFAYLAATPVALPSDQPVSFEPFADVRMLDDGRVAVVGPGDQGRGDVRIFVKEGDRWLLDDWFDLSSS